MAGSKQDTTGSLSLSYDVACCWRAQNTILANDQFLDPVACTNLCNELCHFWIPVASITADDQRGTFSSLWNRQDDRSYEVLGIVLLLKDLDLLSQTRSCEGGVSLRATMREDQE